MPVDILLVEDNAGDTLLIGQILAESEVPVRLHVARDGEQALTMLADAQWEPALIVLDLNIPKISGNTLLRRYQNRDVPVVVFSSTWNTDEINEALSLGASQYVQKPNDIQAFTDAVSGMVLKWLGPPHDNASRAAT
jgi:two-component system, response regulator